MKSECLSESYNFFYDDSENPKKVVKFGVELETGHQTEEGCFGSHRTVRDLFPNAVNIVGDGSIHARYSSEFRFHPGSMLYWQEQLNNLHLMYTAFKDLEVLIGDKFNTGMHIHFSGPITRPQLYRVFHFYYRNPWELFTFGGRSVNCQRTYGAFSVRLGDKTRRHKQVWKSLQQRPGGRITRTRDWLWGRNVCHPSRHGTIEIRLFTAPKTVDRFMANVELVNAIIEFSRKRRIADLTWSRLVDYVGCENKSRYLLSAMEDMNNGSSVKKGTDKRCEAAC